MPSSSSPLHRRSTGTSFRAESLGYQVNHLARLLEAALRARIAPHSVAPGQFAQLLALYESDGVSQADLCREVDIDQSTMALTLRRMERDDLVTRQFSEHDRRRTEIWLTARARALESTLVACARDTNAVATEGIDQADLSVTLRVLAKAIQNLSGDDDEGASS